MRMLSNSVLEKIVYISYNPATHASYIYLLNGDYAAGKVHPSDLFNQTQHVENVVLLKRKKVTLNKR